MCIHGDNKHKIDITWHKPNLSCARYCEPSIHSVASLTSRPTLMQPFSAVISSQCFVYRASGISTRITNYFSSNQVDLRTGSLTILKKIQKQLKRITMAWLYRMILRNPVVQNRVTDPRIVN